MVLDAFHCIRDMFLRVIALALLEVQQPFALYTTENTKIALRGLGQMNGLAFTPIAYLSKQLETSLKVDCLVYGP